jgi:hypothetical protein
MVGKAGLQGGDYVRIAKIVDRGMKDNWSEVRFSASKAAREVMLKGGEIERVRRAVMPSVCFNRHHKAEGVRNYNQETWRLVVVGDSGKRDLCRFAEDVKELYVG